MKLATTIVTMILVSGSLAVHANSAEPKATGPMPRSESAGPAASDEIAALRAELHRTLAALREARSAENPDAAKVAQLEQMLRQFRERLIAEGGAGRGMGYGRGAGYGPGAGFGYRGGRGPGGGPGGGYGYRGGRGPGPGPGCGGPGGSYGMGRGFGPGGGQGRAPGGPWFADEDNDGVCDRYQQRSGAAK